MAQRKNTTPTEFEEQCALVQYLELKGLRFTSIPNSTWTPSFAQKRKNVKSGLRPGLPDMLVLLPSVKLLLWVEMKRMKGGSLSEDQEAWIEDLNMIGENVKAIVCRGAGEAIDMIEILLNPLTSESF